MRLITLTAALTLTLAAAAPAQFVVIRDRIETLQGGAGCNDGATHSTAALGIRLAPTSGIDLSQYMGQAVEIRGTRRVFSCVTVYVGSVRPISDSLEARVTWPQGNVQIEFSGSRPGTLNWLYFSRNPQWNLGLIPGIDGPWHLNLLTMYSLGGAYVTTAGSPFLSVPVPNPAMLSGQRFYFQAITLDPLVTVGTTNLERLSFDVAGGGTRCYTVR